MCSPLRLFELLGVAQKNDAIGSLGDGQCVGQRHLAGLVHEQNIDRLDKLGSTPQPRGSAKNVDLAGLKGFESGLIVLDLQDWASISRSFVYFVAKGYVVSTEPRRRLSYRIEELTDHAM